MNRDNYLRGLEASNKFLGQTVHNILGRFESTDPEVIAAFERLGELELEVMNSAIPWEDYKNVGDSYRLMYYGKEYKVPKYQMLKEAYETALASIIEDKRDLVRLFCEEGLGGVEKKFYEYYIKPETIVNKYPDDEILKLSNEECVGKLEWTIRRKHPTPYLDIVYQGDEVLVKCVDFHTRPDLAYWYYFYLEFEVIVNGSNYYRFSREQKKSNDEIVSVPRMLTKLLEDFENGFVDSCGFHPCMYTIKKLEGGEWVYHYNRG